jgi:hypothetical protein
LNTGHITPGTAIAYILMEVGATPQLILDQLNQHITSDGHHGHGDVLTCLAIPDQLYDVQAEVVFSKNLKVLQISNSLTEIDNRIRAAFRETEAFQEMTRANPNARFSVSKIATEIHNNMSLVESVKITVDGNIQEDIVSNLTEPRINTLSVQEVL